MTITARTDEYLSRGYDLGDAIAQAVTDASNKGRDARCWEDHGQIVFGK